MIKLKSPAEWQGIFYVGQDRTATERNYVAEATRRRRRILQAGFFHIRHNYKNDCYICGNFCAYTVKTASSEAYP